MNWGIIKMCDQEKKEFVYDNPARNYDILKASEDYRHEEFEKAYKIVRGIEGF